jgi:molybdate transport system regulatory protein
MHSKQIQPRFRVLWGKEIALGPGKAQLLEHIQQTGSIAEAARQLDMSYMRAWTLIRTMNACFKEPLVEAQRGGHAHGGAVLTETGEEALALYQRMQTTSLEATKGDWQGLKKLLRD